MSIQAQLRWTQKMQFVGRAEESPAVVIDNHEGGSGASPMELVLLGTAGCTAVDVISILKKKRMAVSSFTVNVTGTRADDHPRRYTEILVEFVVRGTNIKPEGVQQAIDLSANKYCGAIASLNARVTHEFRIETDQTVK